MNKTDTCSEIEHTSESDSERECCTQIMTSAKEENCDVEQFWRFLHVTKGKRNVVVDDCFSNQAKFIESAKVMMKDVGGDGLTETEVY